MKADFSIDVVDISGEALRELNKVLKKNRSKIVKIIKEGPAGGNPELFISSPSLDAMFNIVEYLYGPDDAYEFMSLYFDLND